LNREEIQNFYDMVMELNLLLDSVKENCYLIMNDKVDEAMVSERIYAMDELMRHLSNLSEGLMSDIGEPSIQEDDVKVVIEEIKANAVEPDTD